MKSLILLLIITAIVVSGGFKYRSVGVQREWNIFKLEYNKDYATWHEDNWRRGIYLKNRKFIDEHNERYSKGEESYWLEMNHFGDISDEEFLSMMGADITDYDESKPVNNNEVKLKSYLTPISVDWRRSGAVSPVGFQGNCNSGYAFAATGVIEAQMYIKRRQLIPLSQQNIIDCVSSRYGCNTGTPLIAFQMIQQYKGIEANRTYPYTGRVHGCQYKAFHRVANITSFGFVSNTIPHMEYHVAYRGPFAVTVNSTLKDFRFYRGGIYKNQGCSYVRVNHGMLLIGYGGILEKYWLLKNSWGPRWGENGFMRIAKDFRNICGVASRPEYAL